MTTLSIKRFPVNAPASAMLDIANRYAVAIERRGREATEPDFLAGVWAARGAHFVRQGKNFLMLASFGPVWIATHFAPHTLKGGVRLLSTILEQGLPVVFCVPRDLADNLARLGWKEMPRWFNALAHTQGMPSDKVVLVPAGLVMTAAKAIRSKGLFNIHADSAPALEVMNPRTKQHTTPNRQPRKWQFGCTENRLGLIAI